jgi:hypothetical protein
MPNNNQFKKSNEDRRYFYNKMPSFRLFLATNNNMGESDPKTVITSYMSHLDLVDDLARQPMRSAGRWRRQVGATARWVYVLY